MPWDMEDYPNSMKNLPQLVRKKAIDIANVLEENGYDEDRAIPIAISQAKEWADDASPQEKKEWRNEPSPKKEDDHSSDSNADLLDNDVEVYFEEEEWKVKTKEAKRPSRTFSLKEDAVERAKEIAENKNSHVYIYKKDGTLQEERGPLSRDK